MKEHRGIVLSESEKVIREYEASFIKEPKTEGYVVATNRRLIFTGNSSSMLGNSLLVRETQIDQINGIVSHLNRGKSIGQIIFGIIISLIGLYMLFQGGLLTFFGIIVTSIGGYNLYRAIMFPGVEMYLSVLTSGESSSAIQVSVQQKSSILSRFGLGGNNAWMAIGASAPGRHTEQMIAELGALVRDIQVMGDHAIDKWSNIPLNGKNVELPKNPDLKSTFNKVKETAASTTISINEQVKKHTKSNKVTPQASVCTCNIEHDTADAFCHECGGKVEKENIFA